MTEYTDIQNWTFWLIVYYIFLAVVFRYWRSMSASTRLFVQVKQGRGADAHRIHELRPVVNNAGQCVVGLADARDLIEVGSANVDVVWEEVDMKACNPCIRYEGSIVLSVDGEVLKKGSSCVIDDNSQVTIMRTEDTGTFRVIQIIMVACARTALSSA